MFKFLAYTEVRSSCQLRVNQWRNWCKYWTKKPPSSHPEGSSTTLHRHRTPTTGCPVYVMSFWVWTESRCQQWRDNMETCGASGGAKWRSLTDGDLTDAAVEGSGRDVAAAAGLAVWDGAEEQHKTRCGTRYRLFCSETLLFRAAGAMCVLAQLKFLFGYSFGNSHFSSPAWKISPLVVSSLVSPYQSI